MLKKCFLTNLQGFDLHLAGGGGGGGGYTVSLACSQFLVYFYNAFSTLFQYLSTVTL